MPKPLPDSAAATALTIFHRILADRGATPLSALVADLALPRSTLHRFTATLEAAGYIARRAPGQYDVALAFAEAAQGLSASTQLARASRPVLAELAENCRATAHLGVLEADMVTYLVKARATALDQPDIFTRENAQLEAYCSGIGKVLLAWLPEAERAAYLANGPFVALTPHTITEPAQLATALEAARREGFATDDGEISPDLYCLAVPLWPEQARMPAAISLSFTRGEEVLRAQHRHLARLRAAAASIARRLGPPGSV